MRATTLEMEAEQSRGLRDELPQIETIQDTPPAPSPSREQIRQRAYCLWQERGCPIGSPEEDWYRAEAELRQSGGDGF